MSLKVQLTGTAPGYGRLKIAGLPHAASVWEIGIQRNFDDRYLGADRQWQSTPYWHRLSMVVVRDGGIEASVGPEIVDAVVAASNLAFMVSVRTGAASGRGVLRVSGRVLGSGAAGKGADFPEAPTEEPAPMDESTVIMEPSPPRPEPLEVETATQTPEAGARSGKTRYLILALVLLLLAGAAVAAWYLGLFAEDVPPSASQPQAASAAPQVGRVPEPVAEEPPSRVGRARAHAFLNRDPRPEPQAMLAQAGAWQQSGDCEAAMIVFVNAARADATAALQLARRYDPEHFSADPCIEVPDAETAAYWYERPAREGDPAAQRRLGQILTRQYASGPLFEQGLKWLKQAAAAGDPQAEAALAELRSVSSAD